MIQKTQIQIDNLFHNVIVHIERRNSIRASITKTGINIRIPKHLSYIQRNLEIKKLTTWAIKKIKSTPQRTSNKKVYAQGDIIKTHSKIYKLQIETRDSIKNFAKITDSHIIIKIANHHNDESKQKYISKQLRKLLAKEHLAELKYHVQRLNEIHLNKKFKKVSYKYTVGRWGACNSTTKEINLSTRLLLAPLPILEYVIIHELAHLIEPNHSKRFWNIVKSIDPNYKEKKKWINANGNSLNI